MGSLPPAQVGRPCAGDLASCTRCSPQSGTRLCLTHQPHQSRQGCCSRKRLHRHHLVAMMALAAPVSAAPFASAVPRRRRPSAAWREERGRRRDFRPCRPTGRGYAECFLQPFFSGLAADWCCPRRKPLPTWLQTHLPARLAFPGFLLLPAHQPLAKGQRWLLE